MLVRFSILKECAGKNVLLNRSKFVCGIGFNNMGCVGIGGRGGLANMILLGRNKETKK
jgi:hypothetical protein